MITTQLQKKKLTFSFLSFFPFYFLSCYSQFSNWLHFQSNLPISISPSHPPLNRAALQVSVGLWYLFMINEGEKKKCKCLPPTQGEINQNRSAGRKEGKGGRKATADRSPLKALKPGNHPSSHIYTQAHAPASANAHTRKRSATHKAVQTRPNLRRGACQKIELECFQSNTLRCLYNNETSPALNAMDVSAGASGRAFLMLFSKYQRQYELHWMRLYPPQPPPHANYFVLTVPFTGARAAHHLSEKAVCFHRPASSGTVSIESLFSNSTVCWFFCFVLHISISPRSLGVLTIASFFKCDKPIKHSYEKGWWG